MSQGSGVPRTPGWVLNELATAGRENLDPVHASQYDRKEDARAAEEVQLLVELGLDETKDVVDLGAGTGQFAVAAADVSNRVIAVDVSDVMLAFSCSGLRPPSLCGRPPASNHNPVVMSSALRPLARRRSRACFRLCP